VTASSVKTTIVRLGISPKIVRRTAIAVYEAEMNMIFYAGGGRIEIKLAPDVIELCASDQGDGIPDIEKAMEPGFSTAPASVRELGFGAGMGLCNIKASTDRMTLESVVGEGTTLRAEINMGETDET
jgi:anti-sigma regulatory factor (Ser/Thr protein kinase)